MLVRDRGSGLSMCHGAFCNEAVLRLCVREMLSCSYVMVPVWQREVSAAFHQ